MTKELELYFKAIGGSVRKQIEALSDEELALWSDKLFQDGFENPSEHVKRAIVGVKPDVQPF